MIKGIKRWFYTNALYKKNECLKDFYSNFEKKLAETKDYCSMCRNSQITLKDLKNRFKKLKKIQQRKIIYKYLEKIEVPCDVETIFEICKGLLANEKQVIEKLIVMKAHKDNVEIAKYLPKLDRDIIVELESFIDKFTKLNHKTQDLKTELGTQLKKGK
ncbi:hypothetical protein VO56_02230 [Mycoplasmopsis gallinacea]|uniref:Uncharacterized protein n=1 Tax=Mycoplasmopsis gallinacea TaxID=29556 RepID=A0A0D5ZJV2_9BACT|nr:hypothetical protein VO56_02230 [Mycoplasmopsis gallinacea]